RLAAEADFAIAIYNPRSASRPEGFARALDVLKQAGCGDRTVIFAHAVTTPKERIETVSLQDARPDMADMATLVIVGNSATRRVGRWVYAPRRAQGASQANPSSALSSRFRSGRAGRAIMMTGRPRSRAASILARAPVPPELRATSHSMPRLRINSR